MSRVLALLAHPDDAEIGMGGTLALLSQRGHEVQVWVASVPDQRETRLAEVAAGAAVLGVAARVIDRPGCWQAEDIPAYALVSVFDQVVREFDPGVIFTHFTGDPHSDHVRVANAAISSTRDRSCDVFMVEPPNQYAAAATPFAASSFVDVSATFDIKLKAVAAHRSQAGRRNYAEHLSVRARFHGERLGCQYAEAFCCLRQMLFR